MGHGAVSAILGGSVVAGLTALGWLIRQPLLSLMSRVDRLERTVNSKFSDIEQWRLNHIEYTHSGRRP